MTKFWSTDLLTRFIVGKWNFMVFETFSQFIYDLFIVTNPFPKQIHKIELYCILFDTILNFTWKRKKIESIFDL